jgi:hypothetical protein
MMKKQSKINWIEFVKMIMNFFSHTGVQRGGNMKKGVNHTKVKVLSKDYIFHMVVFY